ncbi:PEP-CTERM sorting domain-containing protein [Massilia sp. NR 4-1]|uniref:CBM96 family carbohydrate-binding protein n=1 Tax=Massilia sp. NR 4-1 TaxID=1678028 RepID=UPI0016802FC2|nr:PEP-CTERM sorting domain-containing protein [Massilia sp. NR 4-1]
MAGVITSGSQNHTLTASKFWTTNYKVGKTDFDVAGKAYAGNADYNGHFRFFEKFVLPEYETGSMLSSAVLTFTPRVAWEAGAGLQVFGTSPDWRNRTDYYHQPPITTGLLGLLTYDKARNISKIDITEYLNSIRSTTQEVSFIVKSGREGSNWIDFANFTSFGLDISVQPGSPSNPGKPVPEPGSIALVLAGLGLIIWRRSRKSPQP